MPVAPAETCAAHPGVAAAFRCDGCGKALCHDCIREGHRLLFCRLCGERALPLAASGPATTVERRSAAARERTYSLADILGYPLRGAGAWLFGTYAALLVVFSLVESVAFGGVFTLVLRCAILVLLPGLLFAVIRRTAAGDDDMPDWPDIGETGDRAREIVAFLLVGFLAAVPLALLLRWLRCGDGESLAHGPGSAGCWIAVLLGIALGAALAIPAAAVYAAYQGFVLTLRVDLHLRFLATTGGDGLATLALVVALLSASQLAAGALGALPLLGGAVAGALAAYALFVGAHRIGLLVRRHAAEMDELYLG